MVFYCCMTTLVKEVYEAFIDAGASEEKAIRAAETVASHKDNTLATKSDIDEVKRELVNLKSNLIMWVAGFHIASVGIIVTLLLTMS